MMRTQIRNRWAIALGIAAGIAATMPARAVSVGHACVAAPIAARDAAAVNAAPGFVVRQVITDRVLDQRWAIFADCAHPERPLEMVQLAAPFSLRNVPSVENPQSGKIISVPSSPYAAARIRPIAVPAGHLNTDSTPRSSTASDMPGPVLVRAGDRVHLWSAGRNVRLEIEAIALEYGHAGQVIHLRRLGNDAGQRTVLAGVVDGAGSAELLP